MICIRPELSLQLDVPVSDLARLAPEMSASLFTQPTPSLETRERISHDQADSHRRARDLRCAYLAFRSPGDRRPERPHGRLGVSRHDQHLLALLAVLGIWALGARRERHALS